MASVIEPRQPLGGVRLGAVWERERAEAWIRLGGPVAVALDDDLIGAFLCTAEPRQLSWRSHK